MYPVPFITPPVTKRLCEAAIPEEKTAYADKGIPVIVGEYSAMKRTKEDKIEGTSELAIPTLTGRCTTRAAPIGMR